MENATVEVDHISNSSDEVSRRAELPDEHTCCVEVVLAAYRASRVHSDTALAGTTHTQRRGRAVTNRSYWTRRCHRASVCSACHSTGLRNEGLKSHGKLWAFARWTVHSLRNHFRYIISISYWGHCSQRLLSRHFSQFFRYRFGWFLTRCDFVEPTFYFI